MYHNNDDSNTHQHYRYGMMNMRGSRITIYGYIPISNASELAPYMKTTPGKSYVSSFDSLTASKQTTLNHGIPTVPIRAGRYN